jgi:hypothetical protein
MECSAARTYPWRALSSARLLDQQLVVEERSRAAAHCSGSDRCGARLVHEARKCTVTSPDIQVAEEPARTSCRDVFLRKRPWFLHSDLDRVSHRVDPITGEHAAKARDAVGFVRSDLLLLDRPQRLGEGRAGGAAVSPGRVRHDRVQHQLQLPPQPRQPPSLAGWHALDSHGVWRRAFAAAHEHACVFVARTRAGTRFLKFIRRL